MENNNQIIQNNIASVPPAPSIQEPPLTPIQNQIVIKTNDEPVPEITSRIWILIEVILGFLLLIVVVSYFFLPKIGQKAYEGDMKAKTPDIKISETNLSTDSWKTFEGKAIGISFKYPSNWFEEDSSWVSEKKPKPFSTNTNVMDLSDENRGATINLMQIDKSKDAEEFNKIKSYKLNEPQIESDEYDSRSVKKIKEGKLKTGEEYVMYFYAINYTDGYNEEDSGPKQQPIIILSIKGKNNPIYSLSLSNYNENGKNVLNSLIPSILISDKPLEWKKYSGSAFSFSYPPEAKISESGIGFSGKKVYVAVQNDFTNAEVIISGDKYDEASNNFEEWNYWYIDWDNFIKNNKNDINTKIPESEVVNGNRIIKKPGTDYMDGQYVDYGNRYYIFKGEYVIEVLGQTGSEDLTEKIVKSIVIESTSAGKTPDLSKYYENQ